MELYCPDAGMDKTTDEANTGEADGLARISLLPERKQLRGSFLEFVV